MAQAEIEDNSSYVILRVELKSNQFFMCPNQRDIKLCFSGFSGKNLAKISVFNAPNYVNR